MITVYENHHHNVTSLHCRICGTVLCVGNENPRLAYTEINKFRGRHEHLEFNIKRKNIISKGEA